MNYCPGKGLNLLLHSDTKLHSFTPLNISHVRNGTTKGCPTRDLRATVTDKSIK